MIEIKLKNGNKQAQLKFLEHDSETENKVITDMFRFIYDGEGTVGNLEDVKIKYFESEKPDKVTEKRETVTENHENVSENANIVTKPENHRPRKLPLLQKGDRSSFNLSEILNVGKTEEDKPERKDCQCTYDCPGCGHEATKLVKFGFRYTFCDVCNTKLFIRPASEEWGEEDEYGNVYVANEEYIAS